MLLAALLLPIAQTPGDPDPLVFLSNPVVLIDNYDLTLPSACEGMGLTSGCLSTLTGIYYPAGKGPPSLGYTNPPSPVFINLRGGNSNPEVPVMLNWFTANVLPHGFVGVDPNFVKVLPGQDYHVAAEGVGYLIQYLRYYHAWLNIDPDRIYLFGRSFGGYLSYALGLKYDYQDLQSPDPLKQLSTRPNFMMPFAGPTDLTCFSDQMLFDNFLMAFFPVSLAPGATVAQKLEDSPTWWLMNPQLYNRTHTPPMCMGYHLDFVHACGELVDPHDGYLGFLMRDKVDQFVLQTNDPSLGLSTALMNTDDLWGYSTDMTVPLQWAVSQLGPKPDYMYMPAPQTPVGPAGSMQTFEVLGATPGHKLYFYFGFAKGPVFIPFCPSIQEGIPNFFPMGSATADAQGRASLTVFCPPVAIGLPLIFHVADFAGCRVTNILGKTWKE